MMENNKTLCPLPWMSIETTPLGSTRICCLSREIITDDNGYQMNIQDNGILPMFESNYVKNIRQQMIDGIKPANCKLCWDEEDIGKQSKRQVSIEQVNGKVDSSFFQQSEKGQLRFLDLKLGNLCNLKCRICGSWSSSTWGTEELAYMPKDFDKKQHIAYTWLKQGAWPRKSTVFWDNLRELLPNIKYFEFTGGEPWMIKEHFELLKYAVEQGYSKNIDIHYNTNATVDVLSMNKSWLWNEFGRVDIAFSVDNVGARFEYERYGANWDEVNEIIDGVHFAKAVDTPNITTQLCFTINIQNVYYLDELLAWANTKGFGDIYFNMMHSPDHMSIQYMTPAAQELVLNKLKTTFWTNDRYQREIDSLINFIEAGPGSDGQEFLFKMKRTDQHRNENFMDTHPEIAKAMGYAQA